MKAASSGARGRKAGKGNGAGRKTGRVAAKYKDPNSDKTWSGRGRRPAWFVGTPEQYLINPASMQNGDTASPSTVH
jgi:DNA-binding protein H-NS